MVGDLNYSKNVWFMVVFPYLVSVIRTIIMEKIVGSWVIESRDNYVFL